MVNTGLLNRVFYFLTSILNQLFGYKTRIIKPRKTKSLRSLPTVFAVSGYRFFIIWLGFLLVASSILGLSVIFLGNESYTSYELWEFIVIEVLLILAFCNQLVLKGEIKVDRTHVVFSYKNIITTVNPSEPIENYRCIYVQRYRKPNGGSLSGGGDPYQKIFLRHRWNRSRSICLFKGKATKENTDFYSNMFSLPVKESIVTIVF